ncbi:MAG: transcriptional repressor LexA [Christensenellaceae bacterium]|jgi:repressor LexA|nr:transcriptional repressor LexA [Christensenellaceae bacterium]
MGERKSVIERKKQLYDCIKNERFENGIIPSIRWICKKMQYKSTQSVSALLNMLEKDGLIKLHKKQHRGIEIVNTTPGDDAFLEVKEVGAISVHSEMFESDNIIDSHFIPKSLFNLSGELFMFKVSGSSMRKVGILDGDHIIIKQQQTANNGQIVAAMIDDEIATIKRFFKSENGIIRLHPENEDMKDIYPEKVSILGLVVGLVRTKIQ